MPRTTKSNPFVIKSQAVIYTKRASSSIDSKRHDQESARTSRSQNSNFSVETELLPSEADRKIFERYWRHDNLGRLRAWSSNSSNSSGEDFPIEPLFTGDGNLLDQRVSSSIPGSARHIGKAASQNRRRLDRRIKRRQQNSATRTISTSAISADLPPLKVSEKNQKKPPNILTRSKSQAQINAKKSRNKERKEERLLPVVMKAPQLLPWPTGIGYRGDDYIYPEEVHKLVWAHQNSSPAPSSSFVKIDYSTMRTYINETETIKIGPRKWKLAVATGPQPNAVSSSKVTLIFYGQHGRSPAITLSPPRLAFFSGTTEEFDIIIPDVGDIYNLRVSINASGLFPDWLCDHLKIYDDSRGKMIIFPCRRWLNDDNPEIQIKPESPETNFLNSTDNDLLLKQVTPLFIGDDFDSSSTAVSSISKLIEYEIAVKTGDLWNASTEGKVAITIFGQHGDSGELALARKALRESNKKETFRKHQLDTFVVKSKPLGEILWIRLEHWPKSAGFGWYLEYVIVTERQAGDKFFFTAGQWLTVEEGIDKPKNREGKRTSSVSLDLRAITVATYIRLIDEELWPLESWKFKERDVELVLYSCSSWMPLRITSGGFIDAKSSIEDLDSGNAVFQVCQPASKNGPDSVVGLVTLSRRPFCLAFKKNAITSEEPATYYDACDVRVRTLPNRCIMLESFKYPGCYLSVTSHGQLYVGTELSFPPSSDQKFICYTKGCFRDGGVVTFCTSQLQTLSLYRDDLTLWGQGKKEDSRSQFRVHKVRDKNVRKFESIAYPGYFLRVKGGVCDCQGNGDQHCEFWVRRNRQENFVVLEPMNESGVVGFKATGEVRLYPDINSYIHCKLYPEIIEYGYRKAGRLNFDDDDDDEEIDGEDDEADRRISGRVFVDDVTKLHEALEVGDIVAVIKAITRRNYQQRLELASRYSESFNKELDGDILHSIHQGHAAAVLSRLVRPRAVVLAADLAAAVYSHPVDRVALVDVLLMEQFDDLHRARELYRKANSSSLDKDLPATVNDDTFLLTVLTHLLARPKPPNYVSVNAAKLDARTLYDAFFPKKKAVKKEKTKSTVTDPTKVAKPKIIKPEDHYLTSLFKVRENVHLRDVFEWFRREFAVEIKEMVIERFEADDDAKRFMFIIVKAIQNAAAHFAAELFEAFNKNYVDQVIRILTLRCDHSDFGNILDEYEDVFSAKLPFEHGLGQVFETDPETLVSLQSLIDANKGNKISSKTTTKLARKKQEAKKLRDQQRDQQKAEKAEQERKEREEREAAEEEMNKSAAEVHPERAALKPTIGDADDFDAKRDCQLLNKALSGFRTDRNTLVAVLPPRSFKQRQEIAKLYTELFKKELDKHIDKNNSGDFNVVLRNLLKPPAEITANRLKVLLDDKKIDVDQLVNILAVESYEHMDETQNAFYQTFNKSLEEYISTKLANSPAMSALFVGLLSRPKSRDTFTVEQLNAEAEQLHHRVVDEPTSTEPVSLQHFVIDFLVARGRAHIRLVLKTYQDNFQSGFIEDLGRAEQNDAKVKIFDSPDLRNAVFSTANAIWDKWRHLAFQLNFFINSTKNKAAVGYIVVTRCELDLGNVADQYERFVGKPLDKAILGLDSNEFGKTLSSIVVGNIPPETEEESEEEDDKASEAQEN